MASLCVRPTQRWAACGGAAAIVISLCLLLTAAHFPSDVLAGWLVAACSTALVSLGIAVHGWLRREPL